MPIRRLDHVYAETLHWSESLASWTGLRFSHVETWGEEGHRPGRAAASEAQVVLAEVMSGPDEFTVFFDVDTGDISPVPGVEVFTPLGDTHRGTRWMRVRNREGRVCALEETS